MELITKSNITFKIDPTHKEGIQDLTTDIFPSHFTGIICGRPGSGKTSLLCFIMQSKELFYKKFDHIYVITRSPKQFGVLFLPSTNFTKELNFNWLKEKIKANTPTISYVNILFIFDDVVSDLYEHKNSKDIMDFVFNRRHLLDNGMVSILITSQKYKTIPLNIRITANFIIFFRLAFSELKVIKEEVIFEPDDFDQVVKYVFADPDKAKHTFVIYNVDNDIYCFNFDKFNIKTIN
jgi:energy-coupling factor transporter ATP-binding protein EcfA2